MARFLPNWRRGLSLCPLVMVASCAVSAAPEVDSDPGVSRCARASAPPEIDGQLGDAAWRAASVIEMLPVPRRPEARNVSQGHVRLLWDDEGLYFFAIMEDEDVVAGSRRHDDKLWLGDVFEVFLKPRSDRPDYYEFQVNPANTHLDMYLPRRAAEAYERWATANEFHWQTAVRRDEAGWSVEGRIPWTDFAPTGRRPRPGDVWRFNLCRYDYRNREESKPKLSCSAPLSRPSFHRHEEWQELRFEN